MFLSEGIQKFLYPDALGAGRFLKTRNSPCVPYYLGRPADT